MKKINVIIAILFIVFSIVTFIWAFSFTGTAKFWPQLFSIVMILLSLGLIFSRSGEEDAETQVPDRNEVFSLLIIVALAVVSLLLINILGFSVITVLLIGAILWFCNYRKVKSLLLVSIGTSFALTLIFQVLLRVPLPQGVFESIF